MTKWIFVALAMLVVWLLVFLVATHAHAKECVSDCTTDGVATHCQIHCFDGD